MAYYAGSDYRICAKCAYVYAATFCENVCPHKPKQVPQLVSWDLETPQHQKCTCSLDVIMAKGCQCGGR